MRRGLAVAALVVVVVVGVAVFLMDEDEDCSARSTVIDGGILANAPSDPETAFEQFLEVAGDSGIYGELPSTDADDWNSTGDLNTRNFFLDNTWIRLRSNGVGWAVGAVDQEC